MTSPELDKAEPVALYQCELEDGTIEHFAGIFGEVLDVNGVRVVSRTPLYSSETITRLSSELAASREREMALERERDEARRLREYLGGLHQAEYEAQRSRAEAAEAEVKRLRSATIEECVQTVFMEQSGDPDAVEWNSALDAAIAAIRALADANTQGGTE